MKKLIITTIFTLISIAYGFCQEYDTFVDTRDSTTYKIVKIGEHWWFAENLKFNIPDGSSCYENNEDYCKTYGRLYTWSSAKKACPVGWHLPYKYEWKELIEHLGGEKIAGGRMKSSKWEYTGIMGTKLSGFDALPGGLFSYSSMSYKNVGEWAYFWVSDSPNVYKPKSISLLSGLNSASFSYSNKRAKFSVRCMKDYPKDKNEDKNEIIEWW